MPIPKPNTGETRDSYVERCMKAQEGDNTPQDQKLAICFENFRESTKKAAMGKITKAAKDLQMVQKEAPIDGTTSVDEEHYHMYATDENGDGTTTVTLPMGVDPHIHEIEGADVKTVNGHNHFIQEY